MVLPMVVLFARVVHLSKSLDSSKLFGWALTMLAMDAALAVDDVGRAHVSADLATAVVE